MTNLEETSLVLDFVSLVTFVSTANCHYKVCFKTGLTSLFYPRQLLPTL